MEFDPLDYNNDESFETGVNFRKYIEKYTKHIRWFVVSTVLCLSLAYIYLHYSLPKYEAAATILIKGSEKGSSFANLSAFESLGLFQDTENSLENEIQRLKSRSLFSQVVRELKLNVRYYLEESPQDIEMYPSSPISMVVESDAIDLDHVNKEFRIEIMSKNELAFIDVDDNRTDHISFGKKFIAELGNENNEIKGDIRIDLTDKFNSDHIGRTVIVRINSIDLIVDDLLLRTLIEPIDVNISKVIRISLREKVRKKAIAVINNLIEQYNADGNNDKNLVAKSTIDFLDERIDLISTELYAIEGTAEQFKSKNRMVDSKEGANMFLESSSLNERQLVEANTELQMVNYMLEELNKRSQSELLPGNIGLSDAGVVGMIGQYNDLILQRNRVLKSSSTRNPIIVGIDSQLLVLKDNLMGSLNNLKSSTEIHIRALNEQSGRISSRIASVPKNEREYKDIVREQETKNALYLFMLQKREESILSNAVDVNKAKIIDAAYAGGDPVSPKKSLTYFAALFAGILLPMVLIYLGEVLDTKVRDDRDLVRLNIPYIGDVPLSPSKMTLFLDSGDRSNVAEAFRYIRTNIGFMLDRKDMGKTVFVTSTLGGEGKSFTAINLATSLALSGKKTVLLALDLRAPKITKYLDLDSSIGVTNFIVNDELELDHIIEKNTRIDKLHVINSGDVPPNPVELLMSKRVGEIFESLKKEYEFIIVDTAPVGMVTDTIQINEFADLTLYIIKADFLDKRMLHIPKRMNEEKKLKNMAILLNGTSNHKGRYGYGYGYGNSQPEPWFKRVFSS